MEIRVKILEEIDSALLEELKELDARNLGPDASVNEWVLPVIVGIGRFILAKDQKDKIIGVCQLFQKWQEIQTAFIHSFYIDKEFRHQGWGQKFLFEVIKILKKEGISTIELTVNPDNKTALRLYDHFGFKIIDFKKDQYGRGNDRYMMSLQCS